MTTIPSPQDIARALVEVVEGDFLELPGGDVVQIWEAMTYEDQPGVLSLEVGPTFTDTFWVRLNINVSLGPS